MIGGAISDYHFIAENFVYGRQSTQVDGSLQAFRPNKIIIFSVGEKTSLSNEGKLSCVWQFIRVHLRTIYNVYKPVQSFFTNKLISLFPASMCRSRNVEKITFYLVFYFRDDFIQKHYLLFLFFLFYAKQNKPPPNISSKIKFTFIYVTFIGHQITNEKNKLYILRKIIHSLSIYVQLSCAQLQFINLFLLFFCKCIQRIQHTCLRDFYHS